MACALTQGFTLGCRDSVGGLKNIYFTELANKSTLTTVAGAITVHALTTGKQYWKYELAKETGSISQKITSNIQNGTIFYEQTLSFSMNKMETVKRNEILLLSQNRLLTIAEDFNGKFWLLGEVNGMEVTDGMAESGTAKGDRNGYSLTLSGSEVEPMKEIGSGLIAALLIPA